MIEDFVTDNYLLEVLQRHDFNQTATARYLNGKFQAEHQTSVERFRTFIKRRRKNNQLLANAVRKSQFKKKQESHQKVHPVIKRQFVSGIDRQLVLSDLTHGSHDMALFRCEKCDSEFSRKVKDLQYQLIAAKKPDATGCPFCSGKQVNNKNNFGVLYPEYAQYWDYEKNILSPYEVSPGSDQRIWFVCASGHSFDTLLYNVTNKRRPKWCSYCSLTGTSYLEITVFWELQAVFGDTAVWQKLSKIGQEIYGVECDILLRRSPGDVCIEVDGRISQCDFCSKPR